MLYSWFSEISFLSIIILTFTPFEEWVKIIFRLTPFKKRSNSEFGLTSVSVCQYWSEDQNIGLRKDDKSCWAFVGVGFNRDDSKGAGGGGAAVGVGERAWEKKRARSRGRAAWLKEGASGRKWAREREREREESQRGKEWEGGGECEWEGIKGSSREGGLVGRKDGREGEGCGRGGGVKCI